MKRILLTAGPIPAQLDSVKFITNRFKGGLAVKTAVALADLGHQVEIVKWKGTDIKCGTSVGAIKVTSVSDIHEYRTYIQNTWADAYVLAAAVANLMPVNPWKGKFPSHDYKVGEEFDIKFCIAPRIIDEVKKFHPRSTLIGYKLFDGTEEELVEAGWETLCGSRSNVVFCNHPATAKEKKIALMPDGTQIEMSFDEHVQFIDRVINLEWYCTQETGKKKVQKEFPEIILQKIQTERPPYKFGTIAKRERDGFITTSRGKRGDGFVKVHSVDHDLRIVKASEKATMNAPFIDLLFKKFPSAKYVLHGHREIDNARYTFPYCFSGTNEEIELIDKIETPSIPCFNVKNHGFYGVFDDANVMEKWIGSKYGNL
jgi:hypothetical protein